MTLKQNAFIRIARIYSQANLRVRASFSDPLLSCRLHTLVVGPFWNVLCAALCAKQNKGSQLLPTPSNRKLVLRQALRSAKFRRRMSRFRPVVALRGMKQFYLTIGQRPVGAHRSAKTKTRLALQLVPAMTILVALAISIPMSAQTVTTFDSLDAGTGPFQGTYAFNIAPSGMIIGFTSDANNVRHGFFRSKKGSFTGFDAPCAGTAGWAGDAGLRCKPEWGNHGILPRLTRVGWWLRSLQARRDNRIRCAGRGHRTFPRHVSF